MASVVAVLKTTFNLEWSIVFLLSVLHGWFITTQIRNNKLEMHVIITRVKLPVRITLRRSDLQTDIIYIVLLRILYTVSFLLTKMSGPKLWENSSRSHRTTGVVRYLVLLEILAWQVKYGLWTDHFMVMSLHTTVFMQNLNFFRLWEYIYRLIVNK